MCENTQMRKFLYKKITLHGNTQTSAKIYWVSITHIKISMRNLTYFINLCTKDEISYGFFFLWGTSKLVLNDKIKIQTPLTCDLYTHIS